MRKITLIDALPHLPEEFSVDELVDYLLIIEKVQNGRLQFAEAKTITMDEVKRRLDALLAV